MTKPTIIGLTGGMATGKSHISRVFRQEGIPVVDLDEISHSLTLPGGEALVPLRQAFGDGVFSNGALDRSALGALVFANEKELARLNEIMHPLILRDMHAQLKALCGQPLAVIDAPLLYETGLDALCDKVLCAYAPQQEQLRRLKRRNALNEAQALARINSQMPADEKARRADHVIDTTGTKEQTAHKVRALIDDLRGTTL